MALVTVRGEDYVIADIGMRMLVARELFNGNAFPGTYIIDRDKNGNPLHRHGAGAHGRQQRLPARRRGARPRAVRRIR
jgi:hypothetical protein